MARRPELDLHRRVAAGDAECSARCLAIEVSARAREEGIDLRESAYLVGIERVVEAARTRGYV